ncbi:MAG TPA: DUF1800 family protein [Acidimicrobiales bacterium]
MSSDRALIGYLYRRAGFGATSAQLDAGSAAGYEHTVEELLAGLTAPDPNTPVLPHLSSAEALNTGHGGDTYDEYVNLVAWWVEKMATTPTPLREKLTLLLHGQFPTAISKVGMPIYMHTQNQILRTKGPGPFDELALALSLDPAMLTWLDLSSNQRQSPNENFGRELMERFTMGIGNYSQRDVREASRALTGWSIAYPSGRFQFNTWAHDFGEKTLLGHRGNLAGQDVVRIVTHTEASHRWVPARMWSFLAYPVKPSDPVVSDLAPGYASDLNMTNLLRAIFMHPNFTSVRAQQGLVKQPVEWVAGIMRGLNLRTESFKSKGGAGYLLWVLTNLGQIPFNPPTVGGWGNNEYWLSTAASLAQLNFVQTVSEVAHVSSIQETAGGSRVAVLGEMLGIQNWTPRTNALLQHVRDDFTRLVPLALTAPENITN